MIGEDNSLEFFLQSYRNLYHMETAGGRPVTDPKKGIIGSTPAPGNDWYSLGQAFQRWNNSQTTEGNVSIIDGIQQRTITCLKNMGDADLLNNYPIRLQQLYKLKKYVGYIREKTLPNYKETCEKAKSNYVQPDPKVLLSRGHHLAALASSFKTLQDQIEAKIASIEPINYEADLKHCMAILPLFFCPSTSLGQEIQRAYPTGGFPSVVCKKSVETALTIAFGESATKNVLERYSMTHRGNMSIADFHALVVGIIATGFDIAVFSVIMSGNIPFSPFSDIKNRFLESPLNTVTITFALDILRNAIRVDGLQRNWKKYKDELTKDLQFLEACNRLSNYNKNPLLVQFTQFATIEYETREIARILFTFGFSKPIIFPTLNNLGLPECVIAESLAVDSQIFGIHIIPLLERQEDPKERLIFKSFETFPHLEQIHHQLNEKILSQPHSDKIFWNVSVWDESKTPDPHSLYFFWRTANLIRQFGHQVELTLFSLIPEDPKTHPAINLDIPSPWFLVRYLLTKHSLAEATEYLGSQPGPKFDEKRKASIFIFDHPQAINYKDEARIFGKQGQVFLKTLYTTSENDAVYKFGNPPESSSLPMTQPSINFFLRGHPRSILTAAVNTAAFVWPA